MVAEEVDGVIQALMVGQQAGVPGVASLCSGQGTPRYPVLLLRMAATAALDVLLVVVAQAGQSS